MTASRGKRCFLILLCLLSALLFTALGIWQVERRAWKLDLIARVDARVAAPVQPAPARSAWAKINAHDDEYRHVRASGFLLNNRETLVEALTERGAGFWIVTPMQTPNGTILVNRGFVPTERSAIAARPGGQLTGPVTVTGLLRITEPRGRVLRPNRPSENRWYSRDVAAIARARGLSNAAPFFIDADAKPNPGGYPIGGMTVVTFRNMHLIYALTWFALAALSLAGLVLLFRRER